MKTRTFILVYFLFINCSIYSQSLKWQELPNSPVGIDRLEDVYFINPNTGWVINYIGYSYKTTNAGQNWSLPRISPSSSRSIGFFDSENGILGTLNQVTPIFRTTDGGMNWIQITSLPNPAPRGICGISIVNENIGYACGVWGGYANAIKTTDKGVTWSSVFSDTSLVSSLVDCYFWTQDSGIMVGGYDNFSAVLITSNAGSSWHRVYCCSQRERCWKISFVSRKLGFISIESSGFSDILKTTNGGYNWIEIPFDNYHEQGIGFVNENTGWVGGRTGPTYETTNGGLQWQLVGWGYNINRFRFLSDTLAYAVGRRVYKYSGEVIGIHSISSEVPDKFSLFQNYPNPFNPMTKIKFDIPSNAKGQTSDVKLIIYDALGKEVTKLVNEKLNAGSYEAEFNGSNFSSGIYFYKLEAGDFSEVKRMILLK